MTLRLKITDIIEHALAKQQGAGVAAPSRGTPEYGGKGTTWDYASSNPPPPGSQVFTTPVQRKQWWRRQPVQVGISPATTTEAGQKITVHFTESDRKAAEQAKAVIADDSSTDDQRQKAQETFVQLAEKGEQYLKGVLQQEGFDGVSVTRNFGMFQNEYEPSLYVSGHVPPDKYDEFTNLMVSIAGDDFDQKQVIVHTDVVGDKWFEIKEDGDIVLNEDAESFPKFGVIDEKTGESIEPAAAFTFYNELDASQIKVLGERINEISNYGMAFAAHPDGKGIDILNLTIYQDDHKAFLKQLMEIFDDDNVARSTGRFKQFHPATKRTRILGKRKGPIGRFGSRFDTHSGKDYDGIQDYPGWHSYWSDVSAGSGKQEKEEKLEGFGSDKRYAVIHTKLASYIDGNQEELDAWVNTGADSASVRSNTAKKFVALVEEKADVADKRLDLDSIEGPVSREQFENGRDVYFHAFLVPKDSVTEEMTDAEKLPVLTIQEDFSGFHMGTKQASEERTHTRETVEKAAKDLDERSSRVLQMDIRGATTEGEQGRRDVSKDFVNEYFDVVYIPLRLKPDPNKASLGTQEVPTPDKLLDAEEDIRDRVIIPKVVKALDIGVSYYINQVEDRGSVSAVTFSREQIQTLDEFNAERGVDSPSKEIKKSLDFIYELEDLVKQLTSSDTFIKRAKKNDSKKSLDFILDLENLIKQTGAPAPGKGDPEYANKGKTWDYVSSRSSVPENAQMFTTAGGSRWWKIQSREASSPSGHKPASARSAPSKLTDRYKAILNDADPLILTGLQKYFPEINLEMPWNADTGSTASAVNYELTMQPHNRDITNRLAIHQNLHNFVKKSGGNTRSLNDPSEKEDDIGFDWHYFNADNIEHVEPQGGGTNAGNMFRVTMKDGNQYMYKVVPFEAKGESSFYALDRFLGTNIAPRVSVMNVGMGAIEEAVDVDQANATKSIQHAVDGFKKRTETPIETRFKDLVDNVKYNIENMRAAGARIDNSSGFGGGHFMEWMDGKQWLKETGTITHGWADMGPRKDEPEFLISCFDTTEKRESFYTVMLYDLLLNNYDRNVNNFILSPERGFVPIDNGQGGLDSIGGTGLNRTMKKGLLAGWMNSVPGLSSYNMTAFDILADQGVISRKYAEKEIGDLFDRIYDYAKLKAFAEVADLEMPDPQLSADDYAASELLKNENNAFRDLFVQATLKGMFTRTT